VKNTRDASKFRLVEPSYMVEAGRINHSTVPRQGLARAVVSLEEQRPTR
jgi:hypothetical protein